MNLLHALAASRLTTRWLLTLLLGVGFFVLPSAPAMAQSCWIESQPSIAFGEVGPAGKTTTGQLRYTCNRPFAVFVAYRVCLFIPEGTPIAGLNPRWMTNYNGAQMAYNLYSDPSYTQVIGPLGSGQPVYSSTMTLNSPLSFSAQGTMTVHARANAGQVLPATNGFQAHIYNAELRYAYNTAFLGTPDVPTLAQCQTGSGADGRGSVSHYVGVTATVANTCQISTASDLDFGSTTTLSGSRDQTSTIQLQCPANTPWRVGLDNGLYANGSTRRMRGPGNQHLTYELYRDPTRTQRWGRTLGSDTSNGTGTGGLQTLTVHGRVPAQPVNAAGTYVDTVTITLTY